jgi:hypothetical protein
MTEDDWQKTELCTETYLASQCKCGWHDFGRGVAMIFALKWPEIRQYLTEETLYNIEQGQTMAHYCTHLCRQRTILYSITADSRQGSLAKAIFNIIRWDDRSIWWSNYYFYWLGIKQWKSGLMAWPKLFIRITVIIHELFNFWKRPQHGSWTFSKNNLTPSQLMNFFYNTI